MNDLIHVSDRIVGLETLPTVNARELHAFLGVGKHFGSWISDRIEQYGFARGVDFEVFPGIGNNPSGGRPALEYAVSLDMAKELAMVERTEKGKQARQYFIECERRLRAGPAAISPTAIAQAIATAIVPAMQATLATAMEATVGSAVKAALAEHRQQRAESSFIPPWAARQTKSTITALAKARTRGSLDKKAYRRERGAVELELRARFSFGPGAGKAWAMFPLDRWPELNARLEEMRRETERLQRPAQLVLAPQSSESQPLAQS